MYVVKVGEYYVKDAEVVIEHIDFEKLGLWVGEIKLSKVIQRRFDKDVAKYLAENTNGELIKIEDQDTCEEVSCE